MEQPQSRLNFIKNLPSVNTRVRTAMPSNYTMSVVSANSLKKSSSLAHTSKVLGFETTGLIFVKKGEQEKLRLKALESEIRSVQKQIEHRRNAIAERKRNHDFLQKPKFDDFYMTAAEAQITKASSYRKNINLNDPRDIKNEITVATNKVVNLRKQLNDVIGGNRDIQAQIDVFRREIILYQQLNTNLEQERLNKQARVQEVRTESRFVNEDLAIKQQQLAKKRIAKVHEQAQLIKQYDDILKTVQKEIDIDRLKQQTGQNPHFHLTQVNMAEAKNPAKKLTPNSPSRRRRLSKPLSELVAELRSYDEAFRKIKQESKTDNLDLISKKFKQQYEDNFRMYEYINNVNDQLNRRIEEQNTLKLRLEEARRQATVKHTKGKQEQIEQTKKELEEVLMKKEQYQKKINECKKTMKELKLSLPNILSRLNVKPEILEQHNLNLESIDDNQLILYMKLIEKRKQQLMAHTDSTTLAQGKPLKMNLSDFEEQIESAKKEFYQHNSKEKRDGENKHNKFQEREEFVQGIEESHKFKKLRIKK